MRFRGEELAILLPETPPPQALEIAERIPRAVAETPGRRDAGPEPVENRLHFRPVRGLAASLTLPPQKRLERLEEIQAVTDAALAHLSLEDLLDELLERVRDLLDVDTVAILLLENDGRTLVSRAARGLEEDVERGFRLPVGAGFAGRIAAERRALVVDDVDHADVLNPLLRARGVSSLLGVPLVVQGRVIGVLHVGSIEPRRFSEEEASLLQLVADRAALAIEHARLFELERQAHREAERRAQAAEVLSHVADGIFLVDETGCIRLWNPAAAAITGLAANDAIGRSVHEVLPGWEAAAARVPVSSSPGSEARREIIAIEIDGRPLWLSVAGVRFSEGTVYAFRDLTEEHRIEELKRDFVATVSHELRTPLAAVYGAAMTLRRQGLDLDEGRRETLLAIIERESDRLARFVEEVLWASRIESGTVTLALQRCDPLSIVCGCVDAAMAHAPEGIAIHVSAPPMLPAISADPDKVRQVLGNLLENAVKYGRDGGVVDVVLEPRNGCVRFSVRDHGPGIPPEEQERIFKKFYRMGEGAATTGTGLGLYICRELVRLMRGDIFVRSDRGEGATFFFELPVAD